MVKAITKRHSGMWKPGQSGNPKGRAPRTKETAYLKVLSDVIDESTWRAICERAAQDALDGSHPARAWIGNYAMGPPIKQSEVIVKSDTSLVGPALDKQLALMAAVLTAVLDRDKREPTEHEIVDGLVVDETEDE